MSGLENINEISLHEKEDFYSHLIMEDIADADYFPTKIIFEYFEIKNLGESHDLRTLEIYVSKCIN